MSQDLWANLETEFERQEAAAPTQLPSTATEPSTRLQLKERLAASFVSGFIPTIAMVSLGLFLTNFVIPKPHQSESLFEILAIFVFLWLLQPLVFNGKKTPGWLLFLAPLIIGGYTEVFDSAPLALDAYTRQDRFSEFDFLTILQQQIESFFSWSHVIVYLAAGALLIVSTRKVESNFFWLDSKPMSSLRRLPKLILLVLFPAIFLGWLAWQHPWSQEEQEWLDRFKDSPGAATRWSYRAINGMENLPQTDWTKLRGGFPKPYYRSSLLDAEKARELEKRALELWEQSGGGEKLSTVDALLSMEAFYELAQEPTKLKNPEKLCMAVLQHPQFSVFSSSGKVEQLMTNYWLPYLAKTDLQVLDESKNPWTLEKSTWSVNELMKTCDLSIHRNLLSEMGWQLSLPFPGEGMVDQTGARSKPMNIFGTTLKMNPTLVYARWKNRPGLRWWLNFRPALENKTAEQGLLALNQAGYTKEYIQAQHRNDLSRRSSANIVRSNLGAYYSENHLMLAAQLTVELRRHYQKHGQWPNDVSAFALSNGIDMAKIRLTFDKSQGTFTYQRSLKSEPKTWTLSK